MNEPQGERALTEAESAHLEAIREAGPSASDAKQYPQSMDEVQDEAMRQLGEEMVRSNFQRRTDGEAKAVMAGRIRYLETELAVAKARIDELVAEKDQNEESVVIDLTEPDPETQT